MREGGPSAELSIEPQVRFTGGLSRTVAGVAAIRQNRPDLAIEVGGNREQGREPGKEKGRPTNQHALIICQSR